MRVTLAAYFVVALSLPAFSQEPVIQPSLAETSGEAQLSHVEKRLLARIKQLEKRMALLEARDAADRGATPYGGGQQRRGTRYGEVVPRFRDRAQPTPAPAPKRENVPDSWQRFEFNGQTFYIVPADKLPPAVGGPAAPEAVPNVEPGSADGRFDFGGPGSVPRTGTRIDGAPAEVEYDAAPRRADEEGDEPNDSLGDLIEDVIEEVLDE